MEELFREILGGLVDTAVNAGIQTLVTGQDYGDAFKQQAGLAALTSVLGGNNQSPLDLFRRQQQQQPQQQQTSRVAPSGATVSTGSGPAKIQRRPIDGEDTDTSGINMGALRKAMGLPKDGGITDLNIPEEKTSVTEIDRRGVLESIGDIISGDGGRMSAVQQLFFPDPSGKPDKLRQYGPLGILGLLAAYKTGAFDPDYSNAIQGPYGGVGNIDLQAKYPGTYRPGVPQIARPAGMADGGFPRKTGAIAGPGTETSDDIPAMLSDGEFVMTARAVRGAGNGNREAGIRRMYDIMNGFERSVA